MLAILLVDKATFVSFCVYWFLVALGFNLATTCMLSLLPKQFPVSWNEKTSVAIRYSNYTSRGLGAVWSGSGVNRYGEVLNAIGALFRSTLWRQLKAGPTLKLD